LTRLNVDPKTPMALRLRWSKPEPRTGGPDPRTTGREWAARRPSFSSFLDHGLEQIMRTDIVPGGKFRASIGAQWPFLSGPERTVQKDAVVLRFLTPRVPP
jgi:hypothetical protein